MFRRETCTKYEEGILLFISWKKV